MSERWWAIASSRGTDLSIARRRPSTSSTSAVRLSPSCQVGSIAPPRNDHDIVPLLSAQGGALGTAGKIAIGCGIAVLVAGIVAVVALGGLAFWAKGKVEDLTSEQNKIEELRRKANANHFTPPADLGISEDRLQKFLEVRKHVYGVYDRHKEELDEMG